ncbi:MAG: hypothetical protein JNK81_13395 [Anaerolineales bacterium]|nr:hypothetical protein [Anaerolineales bacterium]
MEDKKSNFYGTYFNKDTVLKIARWSGILAWVLLIVLSFFALNSFLQFLFQYSTGIFFQKGMSVFDLIGYFTPYPQQFAPGIVYFFGLKFVENTLLILLDIEESARRASK